jgi:drug/metabolite transporter (DMT)-like permease
MFYLALSILCSSLIFVVFKYFSIHKVNTLLAIILNYVVACTVGLLFYGEEISLATLTHTAWVPWALALGILFIAIFNVMAATSQQFGVSVASVATKMSFVVPVVLGIFLYDEVLGPLHIIGVVIALFAVYLSAAKEGGKAAGFAVFLMPLVLFLGSGLIDSAIKHFQEVWVPPYQFPLFSALVFAAAAISGGVFSLLKPQHSLLRLRPKDVLGGIALGVPNYFSIYFLMQALDQGILTSGVIFTLNNVAIVLFSTLLGTLIFKERMNFRNRLGLVLAVISILLVM